MPLAMTTIIRNPTQTPGEVLVVFSDADVPTPDREPFIRNVLLRPGDKDADGNELLPNYDAETTTDAEIEAAARAKMAMESAATSPTIPPGDAP